MIYHSLTDEISVNTGIRKGDSLSPIPFNTIMAEIISNVAALKTGYRMGNIVFNLICYADDAVIIAESEKGPLQMINKF